MSQGRPDQHRSAPAALTGRIASGPSRLLHEEVLEPQFAREARHLAPWYVAIEKVLALEYLRMGLLSEEQARTVGRLLDTAEKGIVADPDANMSDIAFAIERHVEAGLDAPLPAWHVDRSRNDLQSCAQLAFSRDSLIGVAERLLDFCDAVLAPAADLRHAPMPGHTHFQAAQIMTPGFYLAAVAGEVLHTVRRLLATYDGIDNCPLGSGAMVGQDLPWDRDRMARLLGFRTAQPHALTGVAARNWTAEITAELSLFGTVASRFVTDLMTWGSSEYGFVDLPDELSGISSAMPQKKNFPVLERIRGRTAHLSGCHVDVLLGQRNTPYTNLVEVSKEAGAPLYAAFDHARSLLRLFTAVVQHLTFREDRMRAACEREYLGGFSLANRLTLDENVPWRQAQVLAGRYITAALEAGRAPRDIDADLLRAAADGLGHRLKDPERILAESFDVGRSLEKRTSGSVHPEAVAALLADHATERARLAGECRTRRETTAGALARTNHELGIG
ncbi:argininosuccinate lyase [Streptomyces sp. NPDC004284]|uniref:argininosuccinate lyase n=1 Tax=Streptomyces sp. NPDC004284 TaxID=3364695 RepID=UPI0036AE4B0D